MVWPLRKAADGQLATVTEGSQDDLVAQTGLIAVTQRGERPLVPGFGVDSPVGALRVDPDVLQSACDEWIGPGRVDIDVVRRAGGLVEQLVEVVQ
ncbi:hypothetical protein [Stomatohabitans albus]|uniref:hypothetical protein n=1 Tax=Stomatohabitans albus TaxID=3110766 RepID=UPI00300C6712